MIALQITDVKTFMSKLLLKDTFDTLCVSEATISTYNTFQISGQLNKSFYTAEELEALENAEYSTWEKLRPFCFELIKGSKTPSFLKIIYLLSPTDSRRFIEAGRLDVLPDDINGLFLNIKYLDGALTCVTGSSVKSFTMDKSLDHAFDEYVRQFFTKNDIGFEEL